MKKILGFVLLLLSLVLFACETPHEHNYVNGSCKCGEKHNCVFNEGKCECGKEENEEHTHEFGEWVVIKEATETEEGLKEKTCKCGEKETETIEKLAHTHSFGEWVVVKEATETEEGLKEKTCSCGEKETEIIEKLAHTHSFGEWVVVKEATEIEEGLKEKTCLCGEKETEVIEKLPHTHKYENGFCNCGEKHNCVYVDEKCECGAIYVVVSEEIINSYLEELYLNLEITEDIVFVERYLNTDVTFEFQSSKEL